MIIARLSLYTPFQICPCAITGGVRCERDIIRDWFGLIDTTIDTVIGQFKRNTTSMMQIVASESKRPHTTVYHKWSRR